jgi:hypothetical protein
MLMLAPIVFVGVVGTHHEAVEHQLGPSLDKAGVSELAIPDDERAAIVKHTTASKKLVKSLHVGGVIAGQLTGKGASRTFRVVIYDGDGNLQTDLESPIAAAGLTKGNIQMFETNIADIAASGSPAPAPAPVARAGKRKAAPVDDAPLSASHTDDDAPPGMAGGAAAKSSAPVVAAADDDDTAGAAPASVEKSAPVPAGEHKIHIQLGVLVGVVGRNLATDPNTVKTYNSAPVGTGGFGGEIGIGSRMHIAGSFEHTFVMHTAVGTDNSSTMIGRAQAYASFDVIHGGVSIGPAVGFGERYFSIDSTSTARSPDFNYQYVLLGATVAKPLGTKWALRGLAAFEPVVGGLVPPMLPNPGRWGVDFGASLEVKATAHVFARAAFDYQVFQSAWDMKGNAVDGYPTGSAVAGATF